MTTICKRCGRPCRPGIGNPEARLLRKAQQGLCVDCAVTSFLKTTEPLSYILASKGTDMLLNPMVQQQFAEVMAAGMSDAIPSDISWDTVVSNWDMPLPKARRKAL